MWFFIGLHCVITKQVPHLNLASSSVDSPRGRSTRSCGGFSRLLQAPVINSRHAIHLGLVNMPSKNRLLCKKNRVNKTISTYSLYIYTYL